jgi:hypothetical protein
MRGDKSSGTRYDLNYENAPLEEDIRGFLHDYENPETEMYTEESDSNIYDIQNMLKHDIVSSEEDGKNALETQIEKFHADNDDHLHIEEIKPLYGLKDSLV